MGPRGVKRQAPAAVAPSEEVASEFTLELRAGEIDRANAEYLLALEHALDTIDGHPLLHNMRAEQPREITNSAEETGFHHNGLYQQAGNYTAGGVDLLWSATPGVPLRLQAAKKLSSTFFKVSTWHDLCCGRRRTIGGRKRRPSER